MEVLKMGCFYKCNKYQIKKYGIKEKAIQWQYETSEKKYSYGELAEIQNYFYKMGKRYGLLKEFKENGII